MFTFAFPRPLPKGIKLPPDEALDLIIRHAGMTLRDYFAAQAMSSFVARLNTPDHIKTIAEQSYKIADAMMKEREAHMVNVTLEDLARSGWEAYGKAFNNPKTHMCSTDQEAFKQVAQAILTRLFPEVQTTK